jgi:hypothetical protein
MNSRSVDEDRLLLDCDDIDLNIINDDGEDALQSEDLLELVMKEYPDKYKKYMKNKKSKEFNL